MILKVKKVNLDLFIEVDLRIHYFISISEQDDHIWRNRMETVAQKIEKLPKALQREVLDYIDFLLSKKTNKKKKKPKLDWMGGLKEYRDQYTALDLQKKALEWRD